jgi:hypothetical protein
VSCKGTVEGSRNSGVGVATGYGLDGRRTGPTLPLRIKIQVKVKLSLQQGCGTSRLPHFPDNRLTDGGEVVSLTRRPPFTPQEDSWYSFLLEAESISGP